MHLPAGEVVVKPAVGAGSVGTATVHRPRCRRATTSLRCWEAGSAVLVQPYDARRWPTGDRDGFLGGKASHAFTKGPMLPAVESQVFDASGTYATEDLSPADPEPEYWDVGYAAFAAAAEHLDMAPTELLYARVDVIGDAMRGPLLELELVEPGLGWGQLDVSTRELQQRQFALEVESALDRLGLGALSHRRP